MPVSPVTAPQGSAQTSGGNWQDAKSHKTHSNTNGIYGFDFGQKKNYLYLRERQIKEISRKAAIRNVKCILSKVPNSAESTLPVFKRQGVCDLSVITPEMEGCTFTSSCATFAAKIVVQTVIDTSKRCEKLSATGEGCKQRANEAVF